MSSAAPTINLTATGANIKALLRRRGLRVADVQNRCGFNTPQAIYKWMRGDSIPTIDNIVILADMFGVGIGDIVVVSRRCA